MIAALYAAAGLLSFYFIEQAQTGGRGLQTRRMLRAEAARLTTEIEGVKADRQAWERRVSQLRLESLDRDMLEERARRIVNRVHRDDVVVFDAADDE